MFDLDIKLAQRVLKKGGYSPGKIDGAYGPKTYDAVIQVYWNKVWDRQRNLVAAVQVILSRARKPKINAGSIDGLYGPMTQAGVETYLGIKTYRSFKKVVKPSDATKAAKWPTYAGMTKFYGAPGTNQTTMTLPYPMKIAWDLKVEVNRFSIHKKCHDSALRIFTNVLEHYGYGQIQELGLDLFGGCLNVRKMRGGSKWSTHAWGAAIDLDPARNGLRLKYKDARFSHPRYDPYWKFVEQEGWVSLGRTRNFDAMHVQAVRT